MQTLGDEALNNFDKKTLFLLQNHTDGFYVIPALIIISHFMLNVAIV